MGNHSSAHFSTIEARRNKGGTKGHFSYSNDEVKMRWNGRETKVKDRREGKEGSKHIKSMFTGQVAFTLAMANRVYTWFCLTPAQTDKYCILYLSTYWPTCCILPLVLSLLEVHVDGIWVNTKTYVCTYSTHSSRNQQRYAFSIRLNVKAH